MQALCSHFAHDHLSTAELELRFEAAYRASSLAELQSVTAGLPALASAPSSNTPLPTYSVASDVAPAAAESEKRYLAVMAEVNRQGTWTVPRTIKTVAVMGSVRLDLRGAEIPAGGVDIDATTVMGEVRIILPPGLRADVDGFAIMGEFTDRSIAAAASSDAPQVRVRGSSFMGTVRVETRMPNEGALQAWKRRILGA